MPIAWITREEATVLHTKQKVVWQLGSEQLVMRGGINATGEQSKIQLAPIIACEGECFTKSTVPLTNALLFRRDQYRCMYCGHTFAEKLLTRDHIVPRVQAGSDTWNNVVAACKACNNYKGGRTPEQAGMPLLAVPFTPNIFEYMYLANRKILGDQMQYLEARFTENRCWLAA